MLLLLQVRKIVIVKLALKSHYTVKLHVPSSAVLKFEYKE